MSDDRIYPYLIVPMEKAAIWGGDALAKRYGKDADPTATTGESWECWDENRVANGSLAGRSIADLRAEVGVDFMGALDPAREFPILTKIIDARQALSVQVHPDDAYAQRVEHQPNGKTECWYVLAADEGAELVLGWTHDTDREEYERRVADGSLGEILRRVRVRAGEAYYLPAGSLHAIGAGIQVFETQQTSDLTYRIFDWNRTDARGKPRELHVAKAADVLDFSQSHAGALDELTYVVAGLERTLLIAEPRFTVERVRVTGGEGTLAAPGNAYALMSLDAALEIRTSGAATILSPYETALVPAALGDVRLASTSLGAGALVTIPQPDLDALTATIAESGVERARIDAFMKQFARPSVAA